MIFNSQIAAGRRTKATQSIPILLGPDGAAGRRGEGAISATPTRPPRPDFGLEK